MVMRDVVMRDVKKRGSRPKEARHE